MEGLQKNFRGVNMREVQIYIKKPFKNMLKTKENLGGGGVVVSQLAGS